MEWVVVGLIIIIVILEQIARQLSKLNGISGSGAYTYQTSEKLEEIKEQLEKIYKILGGELKEKELDKQELAELRKNFIKLLLLRGIKKTKEEAEKYASELLNINYPGFEEHRLSVGKWVEDSEVWVRERNKYSHLLDKARNFLRNKTRITREEIEKALQTDYTGANWLLEELESKGKIKKVNDKDDTWQVI